MLVFLATKKLYRNILTNPIIGLLLLTLLLHITFIYTYRDYIFVKDLKPGPNLKYILWWTTKKNKRFVGLGQEQFIKRNCSYTNCFAIGSNTYFGDHKKFHAVVFSIPEVVHYYPRKLPFDRSPEQKYVISSMESAHNYPVCTKRLDGYFNWTWSYRLDSDCKRPYIAIRDKQNKIIGPDINMHWMELKDMRPVSTTLKKRLQKKTKAAAWFVSNCKPESHREVYVQKLRKELVKFNHTIDIYGKCGNLTCPEKLDICFEKIREDYYFYLSFENSFSEDYVTEKLLTALKNDAVPILYGKANYTRFMPDGIYLNSRNFTPRNLAKKINYLILNPDKYAEYFKWKNHYSYHYHYESGETDGICAFCKLLNDEVKFKQKSVIRDLKKWWNSMDEHNRRCLNLYND